MNRCPQNGGMQPAGLFGVQPKVYLRRYVVVLSLSTPGEFVQQISFGFHFTSVDSPCSAEKRRPGHALLKALS